MSELIGEYTGRGIRFNGNVVSSGDLLLIDFHLNDSQIAGNGASCYAGFIGYVEVIGKAFEFNLLLSSSSFFTFRPAKCHIARNCRVIHHWLTVKRSPSSNDAIQSHTFVCVSILWNHFRD